MGRWQPDAQGRLTGAAMELFGERGYDETTVADIAERAGVTERTFFRYFADKREVLFGGAVELQRRVVEAIETSPATMPPLAVMTEAMVAGGSLLEDGQEHSRRRSAVLAATPGLQERELLKFAALSTAASAALRSRGVPDAAAALAAEAGLTVFKIGFDRWTASAEPTTLESCIRAAAAELRSLAG